MFGYRCQECGEGTVNAQEFLNYSTRIRGYPFVVERATIGVCDRCGAKHYHAKETKRWEELYLKDLEKNHIFFSPEEVKEVREYLGLSMEDFAYLIGSTRQSIHNWQKKDRVTTQSRMADLMMKLVQESKEKGKIDVISILIKEAEKLGLSIELRKEPSETNETLTLTLMPKSVPCRK